MIKKLYLTQALIPLALPLLLLAASCGKDDSPQNHTQDPTQEPAQELPAVGFYNNAEGSPVFAMLKAAKNTIDIEIYEMADPDVLAAIRNALSKQVRIRVIREPDPLGDPCKIFDPFFEKDDPSCIDQKNLRDEILASGGAYIQFNKDKLCADPKKPCFEHGKMVIVDGKAVLISTGNFNSSNLCNQARNPEKCNRDFSMIEKDPEIISFLENVFENDLKTEKYDLKSMLEAVLPGDPHGTIQDKVTVSPYSQDPLVKLIGAATSSIRLENQYLKERTINQALFDAAKRGVKIDITLASVCSFGPPQANDVETTKSIFKPFDDAGISVRMMPNQFKINGHPGYMHAKAIVIDDQKAWVGSVNGSWSSTSNNREFGLVFSEADRVASLVKILTSDHESPDMETWQESIDCKKDRVQAVKNQNSLNTHLK